MKDIKAPPFLLFSLSLLLLTMGCSNRKLTHARIFISGNITTGSNMVLNGYSDQGDYFSHLVNSSDGSTSLKIPIGDWYFYGVHVDSSFTSKCAYTYTEIFGDIQEVDITYNLENCNNSFGNFLLFCGSKSLDL